jgi:membrane fusion protein, heavy metal efflux system
VWIQANIYEKDLAAVRVGLTVPVSVESYPGQTFACRTTYVSDLLDPKTRTAKMRCEVPNPDRRLKLDMFVTLKIPSPSGREAVMVPATAIQQINDRPVVFVQQGDTTFIKREVEVGTTSDDRVEIRSGLKAGEQVVTNGSFQLKSTLLRAEIGGEE